MNDFDFDKLFEDRLGEYAADAGFRDRVLNESMLTLRKSRKLRTRLRVIGITAAVLVIAAGSFISGQVYESRGMVAKSSQESRFFASSAADKTSNVEESFWQAKAMTASTSSLHANPDNAISLTSLEKYRGFAKEKHYE